LARRRTIPPPLTPPNTSRYVDIVDTTSRDYWRSRHAHRPDGGLRAAWAEAVALASAAKPDLAALAAIIVPELPYRVSVMEGLKTSRPRSWTEAVNYAVERPSIALSDDAYVRAVVVDCDHADTERWRLCGLPEPTWIAVTPATGRHHVVWWLTTPVYKGAGARMEPLRYLARVEQAVVYEMGADAGYAKRQTKNPFHPDWHVLQWTGRAYDLDDLYAPVECAPTAATVRRRGEPRGGIGRNVELFDRLRFWAYDHHGRHRDRRAWGLAVAAQAASINATFARPLPPNEVGWTVKSVSEWVWTHYQPTHRSDVDRGAMAADLTDDMTLADRQRAAAVRSAGLNRRGTDDALAAAVAALGAAGRRVTQAAVAEAAGLALRTVKSRWATLRPADAPIQQPPRPALVVVASAPERPAAGARARADTYRRFRLAAEVAAIEAERAAALPRGGPPPLPAFLVAAKRLRAG
jgi:hypothetical protein